MDRSGGGVRLRCGGLSPARPHRRDPSRAPSARGASPASHPRIAWRGPPRPRSVAHPRISARRPGYRFRGSGLPLPSAASIRVASSRFDRLRDQGSHHRLRVEPARRRSGGHDFWRPGAILPHTRRFPADSSSSMQAWVRPGSPGNRPLVLPCPERPLLGFPTPRPVSDQYPHLSRTLLPPGIDPRHPHDTARTSGSNRPRCERIGAGTIRCPRCCSTKPPGDSVS
jgi:hypothetical protein